MSEGEAVLPQGSARTSNVAAVDVASLARRFGRRWALRGVSLRVEASTVVGVVGRNGSGKTTLLRLLATAIGPTRGGGRIFGHDLVEEADRVRELVGLLGHQPGLYADLTAAENLAFALRMTGARTDSNAIRLALREVGLARETDERVRAFSAGMQRRLALARILLTRPRLLLLDEPYASFDAEGIERVNAVVRETRARGGAVLLATHDPDRAAGVVDRVVTLEAGRVAEGASEAAAGAAKPAASPAGLSRALRERAG